MKNLKAKVLTAGLTAAMVLSMGAPVFAADGDGVKVSDDNSAKISKTLDIAEKGVTVPTATFNFSATSTDEGAPTVGNVTLTAQKGTVDTAAIFEKADLTDVKPGQYTYTVKEEAATYSPEDAEHVLTIDEAEYKVVIRVENVEETAEDGTKSTVKKITGITAQKKNSDGSYGNKVNKISFTNKYTEYGNDDPTPGPNPGDDPTPENSRRGLVISKAITGSGADTSATFNYSIKFTEDSVNSGLTTTVTSGELYTDQTMTTKATTISANTTYYFSLTNGGEIAFKVPAGNSYEVEELNGTGYSVKTSTVTDGGTAASGTNAKVSSYVGEKSNSVAYTNDKSSNPLTGIVNNYGGLIAVVAIAAGGMIVLTLRRRQDA